MAHAKRGYKYRKFKGCRVGNRKRSISERLIDQHPHILSGSTVRHTHQTDCSFHAFT